jgi:hypothetical protein
MLMIGGRMAVLVKLMNSQITNTEFIDLVDTID